MNWLISTINFLTEWNSNWAHQLAWGIVWGGLLLGLVGSCFFRRPMSQDELHHSRSVYDTPFGDVINPPVVPFDRRSGGDGAAVGAGDILVGRPNSFHGGAE